MTDNPTEWSLAEAADALAAGAVSSRELTDACLARIERDQATLNTFLAVDPAGARTAADAADARRAKGDALGPLDGIPVAHKDIFDRSGRVTSAGSIILDQPARGTATVIARLDAAGAVEVGALSASEFAAGATGHNRHFGDCRNPWDPERIPGGSSGGSAAAVAARLVYASLGTDTGGSVRLPAHFNGVVGLRPTQGRVSRARIFPRSWAMDTAGPLARTVADCALVLAAIAGADPADPSAEAAPVPDYAAGLAQPARGRRLGAPRRYFFDEVDDAIGALIGQAVAAFRDVGVEVVPVDVPDPALPFRLAQIVAKAEAAAIHERWIRARPLDYDHGIREEMEAGLFIPAADYLRALRHRGPLLGDWLSGPFARVDALITPVMDDPTPTLAESAPETGEAAAHIMARFGRCTRPISYLGLPAMVVPCGFLSDGMPAGFQLVGRPFDEATLFQLGHCYQQATDWHTRTPQVAFQPAAII